MRLRVAAMIVLALLGTLLAQPAHARAALWDDASGGEDGRLDIQRVKVTNTSQGLRVTTRYADPDPAVRPEGSVQMYLDTDTSRRGPEFRHYFGVVGDDGFASTSGSRAVRKKWRTEPKRGTCGRTVTESWNRSTGRVSVLVKAKKRCLKHPKHVRVRVVTYTKGEYRDGVFTDYGRSIVDAFPGGFAYSRQVAYSRR